MRRTIAAVAVGVGLLSGLGCMGKAEYVRKDKDGGVIAIKADADDAEARKLMEKHLGSNYEIVEKYDPKMRQATGTDLTPGARPGVFAPKDDGVMHISYRKTNVPWGSTGGDHSRRLFNSQTPTGLPAAPQDGGLMLTNSPTGRQPAPTGGPSPKFASEPGAMTPPSMFGGER